MKHAGHPPWLCLSLGTHKAGEVEETTIQPRDRTQVRPSSLYSISHLLVTLLWRGFQLVYPGWDAHLGRKEAAGRKGVDYLHPPTPASAYSSVGPHLNDDSHDR